MPPRSLLLRLLGILFAVVAVIVPTTVPAAAAPPVTGANGVEVIGAINDEWQVSRDLVGEPLEAEFCGLRDSGCAQRFERGSIYWSPASGAHHIVGAIRAVWGANGWENGLSGYPTSGEFCGLIDGGCGQRFQNGNIYFHPGLGTYRVLGAIYAGWSRIGWEASPVGYPAAGEACGLSAGGCFQRFANGFVYWSPASGSYAVQGRIYDHWAANGWEAGRYGYPTGNEDCRAEGDHRVCTQTYQRGQIIWRSDRGIVAPAGVDCAVQRCVALTYDDGPGVHTNRLLDTLGRENAKATFFMVGTNVSTNPATVRRMRDMGMELANHTINHPDLTGLGSGSIDYQLAETNQRIRNAAGVTPTWMRPPYGARNSTVDAVARTNGLGVVIWSVDPYDWRDRNSSTVTSRVLSQVQPGSIVLMHDIHGTTVDAAPAIVRGLHDRGYTLVTMTELVGNAQPGRVYTSR
jgi:peptidoglycan/xylan/chitin deacetylase (PgdA/CDA1 family)